MAEDRNERTRAPTPPPNDSAGSDRDPLEGSPARPSAGDRSGRRQGRRAKPARGPVGTPDTDTIAAEDANEGEGLSGSGMGRSGSLPWSVGGTTGVAGENAGVNSPGASVPDFPGISPEEHERLRRQGKSERDRGDEDGDDASS